MDLEKTISATHDENIAESKLDSQMGQLANLEDHEMTKLQAIRANPGAFAWCLFAVWTTILVSFENQATGTVVSIPQFRKDFGTYYNGDYVLPTKWQSAYTGAPTAATAIGALSAGYLADRLGRKNTLILSMAISYAAITLEFVSTTNEMFFGGKFLNGIAVGVLASVCITYVGEITPMVLRGLMTCLLALAYTIGPLTAALILNSTGTATTRWAYRAVFCSQYGFAAVATAFVFFMPESPWWFASKDKDEQALRSLRRLGYKNGEEIKRLANIKMTLEQVRQETEGVTYMECFRRSNLRRTIISIAPLSIQSLTGVSFMAGYSTYYAQLAGFSTSMAFKLFVVFNAISMFGNICSWFLVDRIGRRKLTIWGVSALAILLLITGGLGSRVNDKRCITGAVALMQVYGWFYNSTIGATSYNLLTEVATARLRIKTIAIGIAVQNSLYTMWAFVLPYLFNPDRANLGAKVGFIFGALSFLSLIYLWFYQVETANRSYEELDEMFMKKIPARKFESFVTDAERSGQEARDKATV